MRALAMVSAVGLVVAACSASSDGGTGGTGSGATSGTGAGSGNGGTGGNIIQTDGGAAAGGGGGQLGDAACATSVIDGERVPLDMYIVFDRSGSMNTQTSGGGTLWNATKQAFVSFVNSPETVGNGVGLQFFPPGTGSGANCAGVPPNCPPGCIPFVSLCVPGGDSGCSVNDYLPPAVFIEQVPGVNSKLTAALNGTSPGGGTPTEPAMKAAAQAVTVYASQNPGRKVIIVLATDGNPNDCSSTTQSVSAVASAAFNGNPSVATFVIGINNSGVNTSGLDQIAQAGGSTKALLVDPANAGAEFLAAIQAIQGQALGCTFKVPQPAAGETLNPNQVNVTYTPPSGAPELIYKVGSPGQCDPTLGGWYYNDPSNPTEIELCPATCAAIQGQKGQIRIELGCASVGLPR